MTYDGGSRGNGESTAHTRDETIAQLQRQAAQTDTVVDLRVVLPVVTAVCVGAAVVVAGRVSGWRKIAATTIATLAGAWVTWVVLLAAAFGWFTRKLVDKSDGPTR